MNYILLSQGAFPEIQESFGLIDKSFLELYWHYIALSLVVFVLVVAILYYILKPKPKVLSAYEKAMLAFASLESEQVQDEIYATKLSNILRVFLEEQYKLPAPERTTLEFMQLAKDSSNIAPSVKEKLGELLQISDMVKFARQSINQEQKEAIKVIALEIFENSQKKKEDK